MFINLITGANGGGATAGVTSLNDQKGDLKLKTVNSNDLLGEGNIEIQAASLVNLTNASKDECREIYNYIKSNINEKGEYTGSKWFTYTYGYDKYNYIATKIDVDDNGISFYFLNSDGYSDFDFVRLVLYPSGSLAAPDELPIRVDLYGGLVILPSNLTLTEADTNVSYEISGGKNGLYRFPYQGKYYLYRIRVNNTVVVCKVTNLEGWNFEMDFEIDGYSYHYTATSNSLTFVSKTPLPNGNINSSEVSNIKVLTQAEYDAIDPKDEKTLYMIKG